MIKQIFFFVILLICFANCKNYYNKNYNNKTKVAYVLAEVSGQYQLDTGFYFADVLANPDIADVIALEAIAEGSNLTERCLDQFDFIKHPVAGQLFKNVGGLLIDPPGTFQPTCISSVFLLKNRLFSLNHVIKPANFNCGGNNFLTPGWTIFYHQERHGEESLRYCDAKLINATRFTAYPASISEATIQELTESIVWHSGNDVDNPLKNQSYCFSDPIQLKSLGAYDLEIDVVSAIQSVTESPEAIETLGPIQVLVKLSETPLANAECEGLDCCFVTMDCLANLKDVLFTGGYNIASPFATSSQNPFWDELCPFPSCAYGYEFDTRVSVAPNGSLVTDLPYTYQWIPEVIPYIQPDNTKCIIRSPNPAQNLVTLDCYDLSKTYCEIPINSPKTSKKRDFVVVDYPAQYTQVLCSDLSQYQCQYVTAFGLLETAPCNDVYIVYPSQLRHESKISSDQISKKRYGNFEFHNPVGACVRYLGPASNTPWIYHIPYTSMLHCLADHPRSSAKWCTSIFQSAYFECKQGAGLINGG